MGTNDRLAELKSKFDENPRRYFAPLANEYRKQGDLTQAVALCRTHLPNQPGHVSGHIVLGQALYEARELGESRDTFETALDLDPENLIALRYLGDIAREQGATPAARTWYQRVLDADPRNAEIGELLKALESGPQASVADWATPASNSALPDTQSLTPQSNAWRQARETGESGAVESDDSFAASFEAPAGWSPNEGTGDPGEATAAADDLFKAFGGNADAETVDDRTSEPETEVEDWFALADMTGPSNAARPDPVADATSFPDLSSADNDQKSAQRASSAWDDMQTANEPDFSTFALPTENSPEDAQVAEANAGQHSADEHDGGASDSSADEPSEFRIESSVQSDDVQINATIDDALDTSADEDLILDEELVEAQDARVSADSGESEVDVSDERQADVFDDVVSGVADAGAESEWSDAERGAAEEAAERDSAADNDQRTSPVRALDLSGWDTFSLDESTSETGSAADAVDDVAEVDPVVGRTPDLDAAVSDAAAAPTPFVTETMAELYLQQGFTEEALAVYRQLLAASPNDNNLRERIEALEAGGDSNVGGHAAPFGNSARDFFARFARLKGRPQSGNADKDSSPRRATPSFGTAGLAASSEALTQPDGGSSDLSALFAKADGSPSSADLTSASYLLSAFTQKNESSRHGDLSLAALFSNVPTDSPGAVTPDGISGATGSADRASATSELDPGSPQGDIEQFTAWLEGLKKK